MSDNIVANPGSGGARFATREVTYSGDATTHVTVTAIGAFAGSDDAKTIADIGGDAPNGLDVDVTRLPTLVAGTAIIGKVGIDQTTPGTTNAVSAVLTAGAAVIGHVIVDSGAVTVASHAVTNAGTFAVQDAAATAAISAAAIPVGAGTSAAAGRVTIASDSPDVTTLGATSGAKVVTDATGTIQQYLRGLVTFLANSLGAGTAAAANRVVTATDDTIHGALTETAPTTDTASSGLNGRLQRIAQRLTTLISPGLTASVSVTRTSDTNVYAANDVLGAATGSTAGIDFNLAAISGSNILITSIALERDAAAIISGETLYSLYLYNVTPPSALGDNVAFDIPSGDRASFLGKLQIGPLIDEGATLYVEANGLNKQIKLAGTHLFGYLVTVGTYTPASAAVHKVTINAVQL